MYTYKPIDRELTVCIVTVYTVVADASITGLEQGSNVVMYASRTMTQAE